MNIRVDLNYPIKDGAEVVFRSPVDCSQVTGLKVYYPDGSFTASKEFVLADAHGNNVGQIAHLFAENVVVKVILDITTGMAFVQNADTNAYIERTFIKTINRIGPDKNGDVSVGDMAVMVVYQNVDDTNLATNTYAEIANHVLHGGLVYLEIDGKNIPLTYLDRYYKIAVFECFSHDRELLTRFWIEDTGMIYYSTKFLATTEQIGDIADALDGIIALQNSYMAMAASDGGDAE